MNNQEGYIELDGEVVSVAARKAYEKALVKDNKINDKLAEIRSADSELDSYSKCKARIDFDECHKLCITEYEEDELVNRTWFDHLVGKTYKPNKRVIKILDKEKLITLLQERSSCWNTTIMDEELGQFRLPLGFCGVKGQQRIYGDYPRRMYNYSDKASWYKQFFDLTGKVMLTLTQYRILKGWM